MTKPLTDAELTTIRQFLEANPVHVNTDPPTTRRMLATIDALKAEIKAEREQSDTFQEAVIRERQWSLEFKAKLDAVRELPEKWRKPRVAPASIDGSVMLRHKTEARNELADELQAVLDGDQQLV